MERVKVIACEVFSREFYMAAASSPFVMDMKFLPFGLHNTPDELRKEIQASIDETDSDKYYRIILGYGLCSRGSADIRAGKIPMVIPKMHDCITAFLGSRKRYDIEFAENPGTYWYSPGWSERKEGDMEDGVLQDVHSKLYDQKYQEYVEKYGEDNAQFLIEQEQQWLVHYTRAAFINTCVGNIDAYRQLTKDIANDRNWEYAEFDGDMDMITRLLHGDWDSNDFLQAPPGARIIDSHGLDILKAVE